MDSPERVTRTLEHREPDRVPLFDFLYNRLSLEKFLGRARITPTRTMKVWLGLGFDLVAMGFKAPRGYRDVRLRGGLRVNEWGVKYREGPGMSWFVDGTIRSRSDLNAFQPPDPHAEGRARNVKWALDRYGDRVAVAPPVGGAFTQAWSMTGFPVFARAIHRDPPFARALLKMVNRYSIELGKIAIDLGADKVWISDDFGGTKGPMLGPRYFRTFLLPPLREMVRTFKRRGASVLLHCDGNVMPVMEDIVNTGIDAFHPIERKSKMDLAEVKAGFGDKITLIGNLEASHLIPRGSFKDIDAQMRECFEAGAPGAGYIFASDHSIHPGISAERATHVYARAKHYGRYRP